MNTDYVSFCKKINLHINTHDEYLHEILKEDVF